MFRCCPSRDKPRVFYGLGRTTPCSGFELLVDSVSAGYRIRCRVPGRLSGEHIVCIARRRNLLPSKYARVMQCHLLQRVLSPHPLCHPRDATWVHVRTMSAKGVIVVAKLLPHKSVCYSCLNFRFCQVVYVCVLSSLAFCSTDLRSAAKSSFLQHAA